MKNSSPTFREPGVNNFDWVDYSKNVIKPEMAKVLYYVRELIEKALKGDFQSIMISLTEYSKHEGIIESLRKSGRDLSELTIEDYKKLGISVTCESHQTLRGFDIAGISEALGKNLNIIGWETGEIANPLPPLKRVGELMKYFLKNQNIILPDSPVEYFKTEYGFNLMEFYKLLTEFLGEENNLLTDIKQIEEHTPANSA